MRFLTILGLVSLLVPKLFANPGEPLDCSDWTFAEPGFACEVISGGPAPPSHWFRGRGVVAEKDNEGRSLTLRFIFTEGVNQPEATLARTEVLAWSGTNEQVIASIEDTDFLGIRDHFRPSTFYDWTVLRGGGIDNQGMSLEPILFDPINGTLDIYGYTYCRDCSNAYPKEFKLFRLSGFTTLFEILQSYDPVNSSISFRTPLRPEGFESVDSFEVFGGSLDSVGDWLGAVPVACEIPPSAPAAGELVNVTDPWVNPGPGAGYYFVVAARKGAARRFGRQNLDRDLAGRDPTTLPTCGASGTVHGHVEVARAERESQGHGDEFARSTPELSTPRLPSDPEEDVTR